MVRITGSGCGVMGYNSDKGPARGPLYLVTRDSSPFCGKCDLVKVITSRIELK